MKLFFTIFLLSWASFSRAQKISGTVTNETGEALPFSSITVKGTSKGTSANNQAKFSFSLTAGKYIIVCQSIGYETQEKQIENKTDIEINFTLKRLDFSLNEVVIKTGEEDPAYEIIRQAIKKRSFYLNEVKAFKADLYGKDLIKLRNLPKRILGKKIKDADKKDMGVDSAGKGIIYLSESQSVLYRQLPGKFKLEVKSSRVSGSNSFGFTFPAVISLYNNNVQVFTEKLNPRGFISPIADGALNYYRYKFLGTFWENGKAINSIRVIPRRKYEPLFSGIINIEDGEWRIHSFDLWLTKTAQLQLLDSLQVKQLYLPVSNTTWMVKNQVIHFSLKQLGIDITGNFLTVYNDYEIKEKFDRKVFDRIVIKYDTAVNKKTTAYWDSVRPVPLEPEELQDYYIKDSIFRRAQDSALTSSNIDSLKKRQGRFKPQDTFLKGISRTHYSLQHPYSYRIEPFIPSLEYNTAEGLVLQAHGAWNKSFNKKQHNLTIEPHLRYGVNNQHFNGWSGIYFSRRAENRRETSSRFSLMSEGGIRVSEFNKESSINPLINSLGILLYGKNNMKTYENRFARLGIGNRWDNGLHIVFTTTFEDRVPLYNTTNFTFFKGDSVHITPNYPYEKISSQFTPHQALSFTIAARFRPGQRYIQLPQSKIPIGSKYPLFTLSYTKGVYGLLGSDIDFDKWKFTMQDDKNLKLAGLVKYRLGVGGFWNSRKVFIQDYQHFNGNRSVAASEYLNSFQLASFYANSTTASFFGFGHIEYHLNGLLTNKIPLFRRLGWNIVTGSNAFYVSKNNNHIEVFAGLENIFKLFRVDFVAAYENGSKGATGIRIGAGGLLGGPVSPNTKSRSGTFSF